MFKRVIILGLLLFILGALVLFQTHSNVPVQHSSPKTKNTSGYIMKEYKISKIKENLFYGKSDDGTEITFSANSIVSGKKLRVNDEVICYFEKDNLGKGLIKVDKK